jgi:predicted DNA-binding transcriptional regulator AlpA
MANTTWSIGRRCLLTREQAAEYLSVSVATMARWACERQGPPYVKIGRGANASVRYPSDLIDEYVDSRLKKPKQS